MRRDNALIEVSLSGESVRIGMQPDPAFDRAVTAAVVKLGEILAMLDAHLADRPWVTGDAFSMGDIPIGCIVQRWFNVPAKRPPLPHVEAFYQRLQARPAFKKIVDGPLT